MIGDDLDTAKLILAQRGLQVGRITQQGSNQPADTVVQTNPSANTVVPPGSPVDLIIAKR
ncbi:MAG: PASTA domain-containing protein [Pseudonocardiales bacterium]|nr:PASTA domain-containing protein [Pseudonocardiales bacterium]